ncbi:hypothetical protein POF50_007435 [Streptomyces sp. SL13]|uniref:Nucleotidyltransferase domain-containing protein n=1 Tax=Streptantibioticus silvisoli TaxID=2705255 RepID=A0AA90K885_9ACTN|nr:hypothetical protein [Streptantibioticus silvisoli]MDI5962544.1 hypothetical protein [Streptantibioticus silvisoli]MDI5969177.1 hypothetical protein [Streptantibioticus silvisoli]
MTGGRRWIEALPAELVAQQRILRRLLDFCEAGQDARWFALSCSLARGAADRLSDVDAGIGVADGAVEAVTGRLAELDLGERVDTLVQEWPGAHLSRRLFVQFADDSQLDLVVLPAAARPGGAPDEVTLLDRDGLLARPFTPGADVVTADKVRAWAFLGWNALTDLAKYLERGSFWEAQARLQEARDHIWALWAADRGARYPVFGLSQVLDHDPHDLPPGIAATVGDLTAAGLAGAARHAAAVLADVSARAAARYGATTPDALARYATARLAALPGPGPVSAGP